MALCSLSALLLVLLASAAFTSTTVSGNFEGDALYALRRSFNDSDNVLQSWDPNLVNPCTWFHVTCDQDNHVTRLRQQPVAKKGETPRKKVVDDQPDNWDLIDIEVPYCK